MIIPHTQKSASTTTTVTSGCLACGTIKKSDKLSCCARGGSWFGKCGATANAQVQHTWHEGIQACKARQPKAVVAGQQQKYVQKGSNSSTDSGNMIYTQASIMEPTAKSASNTKSFIISSNTSTKISTIMSKHSPIDKQVTNNVRDRMPINYDTSAPASKGMTTMGISTIHNSVNMLTRVPVNPPMNIPVNGPMIPKVNRSISKTGQASMTETSTNFAASHTSASRPITAKECAHLLGLVSTLFSVVFC